MVQALSKLLYVNPGTGNDSASGSQIDTPLKPSPRKQLSEATAGGSIRLMRNLQCSDGRSISLSGAE
jgi:hypothetical protein